MFALTTLVYPLVLLALCAGAGLLVDRCAGGWLPAVLLVPTGVAAQIALTQLTTYIHAVAPATPYLMTGLAVLGVAVGRRRLQRALRKTRDGGIETLPGLVALLVYLVALAPVLLAGRASFSSYMALADSAVHMLGADFLLRHGQDFAHLDLGNSYGRFVAAYFASSYPSGADTLLGGSAFVLALPMNWAFQPFNAFLLACAAGPAWSIARAAGIRRGLAAVAALSATLSALVYAYELVGSVKEIAALTMLLALGALAVDHARWLPRPGTATLDAARSVIPFALLAAGGVSALGVGFGVWPLGAAVVVLIAFAGGARLATAGARRALAPVAGLLLGGLVVGFICALPTWLDLSGSLRVTNATTSTSNPGNLHAPLHTVQALGVWLRGSYKQLPTGTSLELTHVAVGLALAGALLGALRLIQRRQLALVGWFATMLLTWFAVDSSATTWTRAKVLMLSSPAAVLLVWCGVASVAGVRPSRWMPRLALRAVAVAAALALVAGTLASDFMLYHSSNLAPTVRYDELSSLNGRFAGHGPTLFTDFDEYALYSLRDLDVGGPDFVYPPLALDDLARGYGAPVDLDRAAPAALQRYPLIVTRRNPASSPPPTAYRLAWSGTYYEVWKRQPEARVALQHEASPRRLTARCRELARLASGSRYLVAALSPELVAVDLARAAHPAHWARQRSGFVIGRGGRLSASFNVPRAGVWNLWLQGEFMPPISLAIDAKRLGKVSGQLGGNSLVPDTSAALSLLLDAGTHRLTLARGGFSLAPGNGGAAVLDRIFLTPGGTRARTLRKATSAAAAGSLCRSQLQWVELLPA